ncbi:aldehyde dehydrogenase family protein [Streptomyces sp. SAJ15]|uniref:aldehyde dehydrogenase family protein n=1 Tax=Streptomyces sp. SAJ15 TaxID=2011095 RepID=UPI001184ABA4|nr:aldehyde dehydrogenase family protein [Streptomyces sp. SAJ15]TVL90757.1 aldehyde dehydrogenase (NADP(+)) [Streptomyces sp. SAJ15]
MAVPVWSVDPRTGERRERVAVEATPEAVDAAVRAAHAAREALADRAVRVALLRAAATRLAAAEAELVAAADAETALGAARLSGELARTTGQLRAFAEVVDEGAFLDVIIDHADPGHTPPRPDLRRCKLPLGVVAVYAASNFPLAFSVPGGDTASALAAGCPVVIKAHPGHPATSELAARLLRRAAVDAGLPPEVVGLVHGFQAGVDLVRHPLVAAAGFTGSVRGGRALYDAAAARPRPIPFHGELGSLNPVVVTPAAAEERAEEIGAGLAASMTLGNGQFCTKPGLVLAPAGTAGDRLLASLAKAVGAVAAGVLLDARMRESFVAGVGERTRLPDVQAPVLPGDAGGLAVRPGFLTVPAARLAADGPHDLLLEECFGPVTVVARYTERAELSAVLGRLAGNLTATVHLGEVEGAEPGGAGVDGEGAGGHTGGQDPGGYGDRGGYGEAGGQGGPAGGHGRGGHGDRGGYGARLLAELTPLAGRLVVNGWPTGVAVSHAQHHGGPYPATTSTATSVGATAVERWLRPVVYQDAPAGLLPPELREENPLGLPRRVDGVLRAAPGAR